MEEKVVMSCEELNQISNEIHELNIKILDLKKENQNLKEYNNILVNCNREQIRLLNKLMR